MQQYNQQPGNNPQMPLQYPPQPPVHKGYGPGLAWLVAWFAAHCMTVFLFVSIIGIPFGCITFLAGFVFLGLAVVAFMQA